MKTIYISGPISDPETGQPREGWQKDFLAAERHLRGMGFNVINPVDIARETEDEWRQQWTLAGDMAKWNGPIANAMAKQPPRAVYILACLEAMNTEAMAGRLHGVYVIGRRACWVCRTRRSDGVAMELHMAAALGIPVFAQRYGDGQIDTYMHAVDGGLRLANGGRLERTDKKHEK